MVHRWIANHWIVNCEIAQSINTVPAILPKVFCVTRKTLYYKIQINTSWFGKYDTFFIFHDTVSLTIPENHNIKISFCFLNQETKINRILDLRLKMISL